MHWGGPWNVHAVSTATASQHVSARRAGRHWRLWAKQRAVPEPVEGERRHATVLFADLSGYTAMGESLDPEELDDLVARIKAQAAQIVEHHGGIVNQFRGDEVFALFGVPTAHDDDPVRAVRAVRALHTMVRSISPEIEQRTGSPLRFHSSVSSGLIITGARLERRGDRRYG